LLLIEWYSSRHRTARNALADAQNCQPAKEESSCFSFAWRTLFICRKRCWVCRGKDEGGRGRSSVRPCGGGGRNSVRPWVYFFLLESAGLWRPRPGFPCGMEGRTCGLVKFRKTLCAFSLFFLASPQVRFCVLRALCRAFRGQAPALPSRRESSQFQLPPVLAHSMTRAPPPPHRGFAPLRWVLCGRGGVVFRAL